ncbi:HAD family hydrolase [Candidatus Micrarchaeota archaeon]|nr:HAD family hydrolase [Candidatus Micrarchaeota archaeon]
MIRYVSFDLDGTLADLNFETLVWRKEIPRLYAEQYGLSFNEALQFVNREFAAVGDERVEWYDIRHWFRRFKLKADPLEALRDVSHVIRLYPDTLPALEKLGKQFPLIVISNATRDFIQFKIRVDGLQAHFQHVYSLPTDFKALKHQGFQCVLDQLNIQPHELVHVGDHWEFDYQIPRKVGVHAFYLDRKKEKKGEHVLFTLEEFASRVLSASK